MLHEETCPVCGEEHEGEWCDEHKLVRQLQLSDYSLIDALWIACEILHSVGVREKTEEEEATFEEGEWAHEVLEDLEKEVPEGYAVVTDEDYWSLWRV